MKQEKENSHIYVINPFVFVKVCNYKYIAFQNHIDPDTNRKTVVSFEI